MVYTVFSPCRLHVVAGLVALLYRSHVTCQSGVTVLNRGADASSTLPYVGEFRQQRGDGLTWDGKAGPKGERVAPSRTGWMRT